MKRQILPLLFAGMAAYFATGCCCPRPTQVAVVKKTPPLPPTGRVVVKKAAVLPPTGPILVKEYTIPPRPIVLTPAEVVVVISNAPPRAPEPEWFFTGIRWVRIQ